MAGETGSAADGAPGVRPAIVTGMNSQPRAADPIIELARVEKVYRSGKVGFPALSGVDLTITSGEMVTVTGPSGSGKSTIINLRERLTYV
jgi:ABC-type multidrug transport system fused ATPase/permease subunit